MKKKLRRTGLGPKIHPSSTITACPGMEDGIMKRVDAGPEVDSRSLQNGKYEVVREVRRANSSKIISFPPECSCFCISSRFISVVESCLISTFAQVRTHHLPLMNLLLDILPRFLLALMDLMDRIDHRIN